MRVVAPRFWMFRRWPQLVDEVVITQALIFCHAEGSNDFRLQWCQHFLGNS